MTMMFVDEELVRVPPSARGSASLHVLMVGGEVGMFVFDACGVVRRPEKRARHCGYQRDHS